LKYLSLNHNQYIGVTQQKCCVLIPKYNGIGNLPEGVHKSNWAEIVERYGWNQHRRSQLDGMMDAFRQLKQAGCKTVFLDGSFITKKEFPGDYDCLWDMKGVDLDKLDVLFHPDNRNAQKIRLKGEFIPGQLTERSSNTPFLDFFQTDKETQEKKGIIKLNLEDFP